MVTLLQTTPLHLASKYGHTEVVELLIDWDADVKQRDSDGNNCLDLAVDNNNQWVWVLKKKKLSQTICDKDAYHTGHHRKLRRACASELSLLAIDDASDKET